MTKHDREIVEILEAYDLTRCMRSAAALTGVDAKTVARYVAIRDNGGDPFERVRRPKVTDPFIDKIEELVGKSQGHIRADVVHLRLTAMGYAGTERSTRRAVALAKKAYQDGHRRSYKPWVPSLN